MLLHFCCQLICPFPFGFLMSKVLANSLIRCSIPWRAILASSGEMTPPCGVPSSVGNNCCGSITPAWSHALIWRRKSGNVFNFLSSASWSILSKHLAMSASSTYFCLYLIALNIAPIASWHERPGLNPYWFGSNRASHSG